jgi:hypothetical protein
VLTFLGKEMFMAKVIHLYETDYAKDGRRSIWRIFPTPEMRKMALRLYAHKWPELNYAVHWQDVAGFGLHLTVEIGEGRYGDGWDLLRDPERIRARPKAYYSRRHNRKLRKGLCWKTFFRRWGTQGWRIVLEGPNKARKEEVIEDLKFLVEKEAKAERGAR